MTAVQVLATLRARGARVEARDGRLHVEAPKGTLDATLKAALVAEKTELVDLLTVTPHALIAETFARIEGFWVDGAELPPAKLDDAIDEAARAGDITALTAALSVYEQAAEASCARMRPAPSLPAAVRMKGTSIGEVWLIADFEVLNEEPDIAASGLPIFTFDEFTTLAEKGVAVLRAAAVLKRACPTAVVVDSPSPLPPLPEDTEAAIGLVGDSTGRGDGQGRWVTLVRTKGIDR